MLTDILCDAKNKHIPQKIRKFNKRKDKKEKWMTDELLSQINTKNDMYVEWKSKSTTIEMFNTNKVNFKTFERIVENNKEEAKKNYYHKTFNNYKNNMKKTWRTINETLGKHKKENRLPTTFTHNDVKLTDPDIIANTFNEYFATIGSSLAVTINDNESHISNYKHYLENPATVNCKLEKVNENDVIKIIDKMENKTSSGYDSISNKILKHIKTEISKSLTIIINQMLESGIFPDSLKISKIIPLHKKGKVNLLSNYRPISLLPTISKVFERVIHDQLYTYLTNNNLLSEQQY